ncbi:hypothetical protein MELA_00759 [Candidatus Methylomirabilis lanthanidiphila]|uniref:Glutamine amidotransferase domain-containing protein n=1 Tax=Candidatus Methylomirabilis lanthanidiphila TaxID=2211376 RepID=A0A564ZIN1_9BACT|nr:hypothetical protein MELA_00759 [Candidatus Methylomirabilis lanthanidiphila]
MRMPARFSLLSHHRLGYNPTRKGQVVREALKYVSLAARLLVIGAAAILGGELLGARDLRAEAEPMILTLGDLSYVAWSEVELRTGAIVRRELGETPLSVFSVVVLSNVSYESLPEAARDGLSDYVSRGGSLLFTGGKQSYGSGGYAGTALGDLLPLKPSRDDWLPHPFGPTLIFQPDHTILRDVVIPTMAFFNELDLNSGAVEIAQYRKASKAAFTGGGDPGGGDIAGGGRRPMPLIAERSIGPGTILAIALDMTLTGEWKDRDRFMQNCVEYLLQRSKVEPLGPPKGSVTK